MDGWIYGSQRARCSFILFTHTHNEHKTGIMRGVRSAGWGGPEWRLKLVFTI